MVMCATIAAPDATVSPLVRRPCWFPDDTRDCIRCRRSADREFQHAVPPAERFVGRPTGWRVPHPASQPHCRHHRSDSTTRQGQHRPSGFQTLPDDLQAELVDTDG